MYAVAMRQIAALNSLKRQYLSLLPQFDIYEMHDPAFRLLSLAAHGAIYQLLWLPP
jgi:hypothetical protein